MQVKSMKKKSTKRTLSHSVNFQYVSWVIRVLKKSYPNVKCALNYETPTQLLIATILSAQCTDKRVNQVTEALFQDHPDAKSLANLSLKKLENYIYSTGFYKNKAKNCKECCKILVKNYQGNVPKDISALVKFPGVGRKTANVVLGNAFGIPSGVVVDTHVGRVSARLGLTRKANPVEVEKSLNTLIKKKDWVMFSHWLIALGRGPCKSRKANCGECPMNSRCPKVI